MVLLAIDEKRSLNRDLYKALMERDRDRVIELCRQIPEGPLHTLTIHNDTVLHMATYSKQVDLVLDLLKELPNDRTKNMTLQNELGNTMLHEAATSNRILPAAKEMLMKEPRLLDIRNKLGETALFRAVHHGKLKMFEFLDGEVTSIFGSEVENVERRAFYQINDKTTVLHRSIVTENFDMALLIAKKHEYLVHVQDGDGMTALQILACNPSAFHKGNKQRKLKRLICSCVSTGDNSEAEEVGPMCKVPLWEAIRNKKQRYESALRLAKFLVARDTSWEDTQSAIDWSKTRTHKYGKFSISFQAEGVGEGAKAETALFLATKSGIIEIVEEILNLYPQAVEHIDGHGQNILHVAIEYRQIHIFDFVEKMEIPMERLIRKIANDGNSILHMVGIKKDDFMVEDMRSPALLLQEDLHLFERIKEISTTYFTKHFNNERQTAEELLATNNTQLRKDAKEWLKRTAEHCSIVAVLIATVAFAAAYTIPGGPNQNTGYPLLQNQSFFLIFTLTDVLSLTFALTSVITYLSILTSSFRLEDFKQSLPQKLMLGVTLLILSVSMMMLAFAATVILMIRNDQQWTRILLYCVAFFPVSIFALSYLPLYLSLMKTFEYTLKQIGVVIPRPNVAFLWSSITNSFVVFKSQSTIVSNLTQSQATSSHYRV